MLLTPMTTCIKGIPPGFIDYASSCFDAILYPNLEKLSNNNPLTILNNNNTSESSNHLSSSPPSSTTTIIQHRSSHLPDLIPFIKLITEKCNVHPVHLIMALMYVQRFRNSLPSGYKAEPEAAHRIFVASLLVASKYSEDHCLSTKQVVRATGDVWSIKEITRMELGLLRFLQWDLYIHPDEMIQFLEQLGFDANWIFTNTSST